MKRETTPSEREWRETQVEEFKAVRPLYETYADKLEEILKQAAEVYAPQAIVQARAKAIASFAGKFQRKRSQYTHATRNMTDLCGARVIAHTRTQVLEICEFIKQHFTIDWDNSCDVGERLKAEEFGYLSVHYIVQLKRGVFPAPDIDVRVPDELYPADDRPMKAEIQVRTLLQHAWADMSHELSYKREIELPRKWKRTFAELAAVLEGADQAFCRLEEGLNVYTASYGAYLTREEMAEEIRKLTFVLKHDPLNSELAGKAGKLAMARDDWELAVAILSGYIERAYGSVPAAIRRLSEAADTRRQPLLRDLGVALCKKHRSHPKAGKYRLGQRCLMVADNPNYRDTDALASLAGTWKGLDENKVREYYRKAYEIDPSDPYPLVNYLDCEVVAQRSATIAHLLTPVIGRALQRCRDQADVKINLPWAYYNMGKFYLLLKKPYESLWAYSMAIGTSTGQNMIESSVDSMRKLAVVKADLPGYEWVMNLLLCGLVSRFPDANPAKRLAPLRAAASSKAPAIKGPLVIVAGGCDPSLEKGLRGYRDMLATAFRDFSGTIVSGGTTSGISGLVGALQAMYPRGLRTLGYLPARLPKDGKRDARYKEIRRTNGQGEFSPLEPIRSWVDILASGIDPADVKVLGINGGRIAATEYRIALALGATVAIIEESGREAARLLQDEEWRGLDNLLVIPADPMTVRAFIGQGTPLLPDAVRETIAQGIHDEYRRNQEQTALEKAPSMAAWAELPDTLKNSNLQQADDIIAKVREIGCDVHPVRNRTCRLLTLNPREIELLAEMEHARWNVERLRDGWRWGPEKDVDRKLSPYLVAWQALPETIKEYDRQAVRAIPKLLASVGLEVRRHRAPKA